MKKLLIMVSIPLMAMSIGCKNKSTEVKRIQPNEDGGTALLPAVDASIIVKIEKGTRKQATLPWHGTCYGRSICLIYAGPWGGVGYTEIHNGVSLGDSSSSPSSGEYVATLGVETSTGDFIFGIKNGNILSTDSSIVLENNEFVMDEDYTFEGSYISDEFGFSAIVLPAGTYPVNIDIDGDIWFTF